MPTVKWRRSAENILLGIGGTLAGDNCVAAGNMLASHEVIAAMVAAFETASGELASRLLAGLRAGIAAGARPARSTRRR